MHNIKFSKIAPEGYPIIGIFLLVTVILLLLSKILGIIGIVLSIWCIYFFRDPDRVTPDIDTAVISPCDGIVQKIALVEAPEELGLEEDTMLCISIFMNVFNVHVNRSPVSGVIERILYIKGKFFNASLDKASKDNERQYYVVKTKDDKTIIFTQIAGLVARRIVRFVKENTEIKAGEKFGLIRFGSRIDVYLPKNTIPSVIEGQIAVAGETIIADFRNEANIIGNVLDRPTNENK